VRLRITGAMPETLTAAALRAMAGARIVTLTRSNRCSPAPGIAITTHPVAGTRAAWRRPWLFGFRNVP
jgi:hypothetical protein